MKFINDIIFDFIEFVNFFKMKYKYDQRGVLKRYKVKFGLNKKLNEDMWCDLFVKKSADNYCAKILIIKYWEDNNKILAKINNAGLEKWRNLVENIENHFSLLYQIAEIDIRESPEMKDIFKESDYDIFKLDDELAGFIIERLKQYDFDGYDYKVLFTIFNKLYVEEKKSGINLQYFYKPSNSIDYILSIDNDQAKLG